MLNADFGRIDLHRRHSEEVASTGLRAALRNCVWREPLLYGPAVFKNPYQTLLYAAFPKARIAVSPARASLAARLRLSRTYHLHWDEFGLRPGSDGRTSALSDALSVHARAGGKLIWTIHNEEPHGLDDREQLALFHRSRKKITSLAQRIHVHGPTAGRIMVERYGADPSQLLIIPHPSYAGWYPLPSTMPPGPPWNFLAFGRFLQYKGLGTIMSAWRSVAELPALGDLTLAGAGADGVQAGQRLNIRSGYVPDVEVPSLFQGAHFAPFAFEKTLTSGSLMLAITFGCVPIAPDWPSVREALPAEIHFLLYPPGDVEALASRFATIAELDTAAYAGLRSACLAHAAEHHPVRISRQFFEALSELAYLSHPA